MRPPTGGVITMVSVFGINKAIVSKGDGVGGTRDNTGYYYILL